MDKQPDQIPISAFEKQRALVKNTIALRNAAGVLRKMGEDRRNCNNPHPDWLSFDDSNSDDLPDKFSNPRCCAQRPPDTLRRSLSSSVPSLFTPAELSNDHITERVGYESRVLQSLGATVWHWSDAYLGMLERTVLAHMQEAILRRRLQQHGVKPHTWVQTFTELRELSQAKLYEEARCFLDWITISDKLNCTSDSRGGGPLYFSPSMCLIQYEHRVLRSSILPNICPENLLGAVMTHGMNNWEAVSGDTPGLTAWMCFTLHQQRQNFKPWSESESKRLLSAINQIGGQRTKCKLPWSLVAARLSGRSPEECWERSSTMSEVDLKRWILQTQIACRRKVRLVKRAFFSTRPKLSKRCSSRGQIRSSRPYLAVRSKGRANPAEVSMQNRCVSTEGDICHLLYPTTAVKRAAEIGSATTTTDTQTKLASRGLFRKRLRFKQRVEFKLDLEPNLVSPERFAVATQPAAVVLEGVASTCPSLPPPSVENTQDKLDQSSSSKWSSPKKLANEQITSEPATEAAISARLFAQSSIRRIKRRLPDSTEDDSHGCIRGQHGSKSTSELLLPLSSIRKRWRRRISSSSDGG